MLFCLCVFWLHFLASSAFILLSDINTCKKVCALIPLFCVDISVKLARLRPRLIVYTFPGSAGRFRPFTPAVRQTLEEVPGLPPGVIPFCPNRDIKGLLATFEHTNIIALVL